MRDMKKPQTPATRLDAIHQRSGLTDRAVYDGVRDLLGPLGPTTQTLVNYRRGTTKKPDPIVLLALCHVYGCDLSDVAPEVADQLVSIRDLLVQRITWFTTSAAA